MYQESYREIEQIQQKLHWLDEKTASIQRIWERIEGNRPVIDDEIEIFDDNLGIAIHDHNSAYDDIQINLVEPALEDDNLVRIISEEKPDFVFLEDEGVQIIEEEVIDEGNAVEPEGELNRADGDEIITLDILNDEKQIEERFNAIQSDLENVEDRLLELSARFSTSVEINRQLVNELKEDYSHRIEAQENDLNIERRQFVQLEDDHRRRIQAANEKLNGIENRPRWRFARWLVNRFSDRNQKIADMRQEINTMESHLESERTAVDGITSLISQTIEAWRWEFSQKHARAIKTAQTEQRALHVGMSQLYDESMKSIHQMDDLFQARLEQIFVKLNGYYPDVSSEWARIAEEGANLTTAGEGAEGVRVGIFHVPQSENPFPAVINPIITRRHVFISAISKTQATTFLKGVILRALLSFKPGNAQFILIDGLELGQSLTIFTSKLPSDIVGTKVFTLEEQIKEELFRIRQRIYEINQHVLVTEDNDIECYNRDHPDVRIQYHFIVINSFPNGFSAQSLTLLHEIMKNGQRAGVFVLATQANPMPEMRNFHLETYLDGNYLFNLHLFDIGSWNHEILSIEQFENDSTPNDDEIGKVLTAVAETYKNRPQAIPYSRIEQDQPDTWQVSSADGMSSMIGLTFGGRIHSLKLDDITSHVLMGGRTGSGKSVMLHNIICGLVHVYHPDELEMYLLDFKGSEFNVYAKNNLPHARTVAVDCDVEVGLATLKRLQDVMVHRKKLFDKADVSDYKEYRRSGHKLPRIFLAIDEIQVMTQFLDNRLASAVEAAISDLLRRGRSFGIHIIIGTQSPSNVLTPQIMQQIAVRICLLADHQVSRLVLGEGNEAASELQKQGEAIYNADNGNREKNILIRAAFLKKEEIARIIQPLAEKAQKLGYHAPTEMVYFDGNQTRRLFDHPRICDFIKRQNMPSDASVSIPVGKSLINEVDTEISFKRDRYNNLVIVGGEGERPHALLSNLLLGLCAATHVETQYFVIDLTYADLPFANLTQSFAEMPHHFCFARNSQLGVDIIAEVYKKLVSRREMAKEGRQPDQLCFLVIFGMESFFDLRGPDQFSKPEGRKWLEEIVKEGPTLGIFTVIQTQTLGKKEILSAVDFGNRVCFQAMEEDSRDMLDTDAATKIVRNDRAIYRMRTWATGKTEKFIPYLPATEADIATAAGKLACRALRPPEEHHEPA